MAKKNISVIERRLQGKSALYVGSQPIPLKEKGWTLLWGNSEIKENHIWSLVNEYGWEYVTAEDVDCDLVEMGAREQDGRIVKGERGKEVLLKMREKDYKAVQRKKTQENIDFTFNKKRVKNDALSAVGSAMGSEAAEYVNRAMSGKDAFLQDSREKVSLDE